MNSSDSKVCACCGSEFERRNRDSEVQWESRTFCSILCANRKKKERTPIIDRLMRRVEKIPLVGCWLWTGGTDGRGYGALNDGAGGSPQKAHRVSYQHFVGELAEKSVVRHICDNPRCVNPEHLEIGTQKDNAADMMRRKRWNPVVKNNLQHNRSLTTQQAENARARCALGESKAAIAKDFGVHPSTISLYVLGKR